MSLKTVCALILVLFCMNACCTCQRSQFSYSNPVWDGELADPQVLYYNGTWYAYGTGSSKEGLKFPVLRSEDFANWKHIGGALEAVKNPLIKSYWAPEVIERNSKFYLYYAGDQKMRVAIADKPEGPFKDTGKLLIPDEPFSIDGHPFFDPVSKKWYLFFAKDYFDGRVGTAPAVVELGDDMVSTVGPVKTVVRAFADWQIYERNRTLYGRKWDAWHTVEGPYVIYKDGLYYCFYSGGNWATAGYGVGCAVSKDVMGPYIDGWSKNKASVLSTIPDKLIGPGHNSVILGPDNETWFIVYHAWNLERSKRQICIDPLIWTDNGPKAFNPSLGQKQIYLPLSCGISDKSNRVEVKSK